MEVHLCIQFLATNNRGNIQSNKKGKVMIITDRKDTEK